jgi:signal transduction histidine kinase
MKFPVTLRLRGRLILLLVTAFAALAALAAVQFVHDTDLHIKSATAELIANTRLIAAHQEALAERADAILNGLMLGNEQSRITSAEGCTPFLAARLKREPDFLQIVETLPNGSLVCAATPFAKGLNVADRPYFQQTLQAHEMILAEVVIGRILHKPVIIFGKAIRDENERVTGVLLLMAGLDWLQQELAKAQLPKEARLAVVDATGVLVARYPDPEDWTGKVTNQIPVVQHALATGGSGAVQGTDLVGKRRLFAYTPLFSTASGSNYTLWLSIPQNVVEAPARRGALVDLGIMLAIVIATIAWVVVGTNRMLLQPILMLSETAARLKAGNLQARSGLPHDDSELGRLAETLDQTAAAIEDRERRLRIATEEMRAARDKAEQASQAKSAFLNMVSHELRTPLTQLELQLELQRRLFRGTLDDKQAEILVRVTTALHRLSKLVGSVLDYSHIQSQSLEVHARRFNISDLVAEACEDAEMDAKRRGLEVVFNTDDTQLKLVSDPALVSTIVRNLLDNAVKYTTQGKVSARLAVSDDMLHIEIADTGPGIPATFQQRMFEPFEQGEEVSRKHKPGVGLGLAIVREVTGRLGGEIQLKSSFGCGSIFTLKLPLRERNLDVVGACR